MSGPIVIPLLVKAHRDAWVAILEVAQRHPEHWTLVGGQMVLLHCWERGHAPSRTTTDGDAVLNVRAMPAMLNVFTRTLIELGFRSAGVSPSGHEHRWLRDDAQIDVLIPDNVGELAASRKGATGSTTIQTPGGLESLEHSQSVSVLLDDLQADVPRPHLAGALLAKARAFEVTRERDRERHLLDAVVLASMLERRDRADVAAILAAPKRRRTLSDLLTAMSQRHEVWAGLEGGDEGIERLRVVLDALAIET